MGDHIWIIRPAPVNQVTIPGLLPAAQHLHQGVLMSQRQVVVAVGILILQPVLAVSLVAHQLQEVGAPLLAEDHLPVLVLQVITGWIIAGACLMRQETVVPPVGQLLQPLHLRPHLRLQLQQLHPRPRPQVSRHLKRQLNLLRHRLPSLHLHLASPPQPSDTQKRPRFRGL